jgi:Holliday junction resolvasome RuvABC endonuclease subunit
MGNTTNTVLGIDPGYDRFGWAVVLLQKGKTQLVDCGCIETDRQADRFDRYLQIQHTLQKILDQKDTSAAVIISCMAAKEFNVRILAERIEDNPNNTTTFMVVGKK